MPKQLSEWQRLIEVYQHLINVKPGKGALWSGLDLKGESNGSARAKKLAQKFRMTTLEQTYAGKHLESGLLSRKLEKDFGPGHSLEKHAVWKLMSTAYAGRLSGHVSVFMGQGSTKLEAFKEGSEELSKALNTDGKDPRAFAMTSANGEKSYFLRKDMERIENKIMFDEIFDLDIADPLVGSGAVTSVSITEFNEKDEAVASYLMPISNENH